MRGSNAPDAVARARELLAKATDGPWQASEQTGTDGHGWVAQVFDCVGPGHSLAEFEYPNGTANAELLVAVRNGLLEELAAEVETLRAFRESVAKAWPADILGCVTQSVGEHEIYGTADYKFATKYPTRIEAIESFCKFVAPTKQEAKGDG